MRRVVTPGGVFGATRLGDLESFREVIRANSGLLFGRNRHYVECSRGERGDNADAGIPLYYLLDLARKDPRLFVLYFDLSNVRHGNFDIGEGLRKSAERYRASRADVSKAILEAIAKDDETRDACTRYATERGHGGLSDLVSYLVNETDFQGLALIDHPMDASLSDVNSQAFPVEVLELTMFEDAGGQKAYSFTPLFPIVGPSTLDIGEVDTIVSPVSGEGFAQTYLSDKCWWAIRLNNSLIPQLKYHAAYRSPPISAVTHTAPIAKIYPFPHGNARKYRLDFAEPPSEIRPIGLGRRGQSSALDSPAYTSMELLRNADTLDDVPLIIGLGPIGSG